MYLVMDRKDSLTLCGKKIYMELLVAKVQILRSLKENTECISNTHMSSTKYGE